jgi:hypothetical protein
MTRQWFTRISTPCLVIVCLLVVVSGVAAGGETGDVHETASADSLTERVDSSRTVIEGAGVSIADSHRVLDPVSSQPEPGNHTVLVTDNETGAPIAGARIEGPQGTVAVTDLWGVATLPDPPETVSVFKTGYTSNQSVDLSGRQTTVTLDPAAGDSTELYDLTVMLSNQKSQSAIQEQYAITMTELELGSETYEVPEDFTEYEAFRDRLDELTESDANGAWAEPVVRLLDGETVVRQTGVPSVPPSANLQDETPADELFLPTGTYSVQSQTARYEDTGKQFEVDSSTIVDFTLEPRTGTLEFDLQTQTTDGTTTDWDVDEFSVEIVGRNDDGDVIKRDSFTTDRTLTHHGELSVEGDTVTISEYPAGEYDVTIDAQGFRTAELTDVTVPPDSSNDLGPVPFEANATNLRVDVVSSIYVEGDEPLDLGGAPVSIEGQTGAAAGYSDQKETHPNGTVEFSQIPNGQYDVVVGETTVTADGVTAEFKPQSLVMNLGAAGITGGTPDPDAPPLGEYRVEAGGDHALVANLMPTAGQVQGEVRGNQSAKLWPVVTWPNDDHTFPDSFEQGPVADATIEFEATFDGHDLNTETEIIDDEDLDWTTTPLGVVYGDLPPGKYDLTIDKDGEAGGAPGFKQETIEDVTVNSSGTSILSPDDDPTDRATADPIHLDRDGDYVFGQLRMDVFSENTGLYRSTDHRDLPAAYPPGLLTPDGGPGYYGPIADATVELSNGERTVTLETNESGQFEAGYLSGGDWELTVTDTPYTLTTSSFDLTLDGDGELVGLTLVTGAESDDLTPTHTCNDGTSEFGCPPVILTITNSHNQNSILLQEPRGGELPTTGAYDVHHDDKTDSDEDPWYLDAGVTGPHDLEFTDFTNEKEADPRDATLSGYVYDETTWEPIVGATVKIDGESIDTTDEDGYYSGLAEEEIEHDPDVDVTVTVTHDTATDQSFEKVSLSPGGNRFDPYVERNAGDVVGTVTDTRGEAVAGVRVSYQGNKATGSSGNVTYTDENGKFRFNLQVGPEDDATFRFEHPELYPATGTFDLDVSKGEDYQIPQDGAIQINRTPAPEIVDLEYSWTEEVDGADELPSETHVLSRIGTKEGLTQVTLQADVNRVPESVPDPEFKPADAVEGDYGDASGYQEWLRTMDDIAETEPGNVSFAHTASPWQTESAFDRAPGEEARYNLTATLDLSHVPVTRRPGQESPVTVNVSATTARGRVGRQDRTLADGGTDETNIYVNEPPRPLDAVIGDRSAGTTAFAVFSSSPGGVKFNGTQLDGAYPEIEIGTTFEGKMGRNATADGPGPSVPEYEYKMGFDLGFKMTEDLSDSSQILDTFMSAVPSSFKTEESVTVENDAVESSVQTDVGGSSAALKAFIESWSWAGGMNITEPKYKIGYESTDSYELAPTDEETEATWTVDGSLGTGVSADLVSVIPQLKPLAAAGVKATVGTDGKVNTALEGDRGDGGDAYFGPVQKGSLKPEVTAKFTLGVEPGIGPVSVSVAEGTANTKGSLNIVFQDGVKPTQLFWNGSVGAKVDSLAYTKKWDIAGPGTVKQWDLNSDSRVSVYRIEREQGLDQQYQDRANYHSVRGVQSGTLVEAAYPDAGPRVLDGGVVYIHDDPESQYPASLQARAFDRGAGSSSTLDVGGPPIALATNAQGTLAASHLPVQDSYPIHPMSYLPDAGVTLVDRAEDGWGEPIEVSPAGGETMDLYPVLDSTPDTHYVAWRRDASQNPTSSDGAALAVATVDRAGGSVSPPQILESSGVVAPVDVAATESGVAVLGVVVGESGPRLKLYRQSGDGWDSSVVATGPNLNADTAAVIVSPETGAATYAWFDGSTIRVQSPSEGLATIETDGPVSNLAYDRANGSAVLVWAAGENRSKLHSLRPALSESPTTVTETAPSTRIQSLSIAAGGSETDLIYSVATVANETVVDGAGVDIAHAAAQGAEGPPSIVDGTKPNDLDGDDVYEDLDGDGELSLRDVQVLFEYRNDPVVAGNPQYFDFDGDGAVTLHDVRTLFAVVAGT